MLWRGLKLWHLIFFILSTVEVDCQQVRLTSSLSRDENIVCENDHLVFSCHATGTASSLFWFLDTTRIHTQRRNDLETTSVNTQSGTYAALFRNTTGNEELESELIFTRLPSTNTFEVICSFGGQDESISVSVLRGTPPAVASPSSNMVAPNVLNVSWSLSSPGVQSYQVNVSGTSYGQVIDEYAIIVVSNLREGETVDVTIAAMDVCKREGPPTSLAVVYYTPTSPTDCPATPTASGTATAGATDTATMASNTNSNSCSIDKMTIDHIDSDMNDIKIITGLHLALFLFSLVGAALLLLLLKVCGDKLPCCRHPFRIAASPNLSPRRVTNKGVELTKPTYDEMKEVK